MTDDQSHTSRTNSGRYLLSFAQQRLWFLNQLDPEGSAYSGVEAHRLLGAINVTALDAALRAVAQRHAILRTRFESADGQPFQVVCPTAEARLSVVDLSAVGDPDR